MRHDADGQIVEVGARTRTIPPALRRALQHRDRGCRFPGCTVRLGQGHHIGTGRPVPDDAVAALRAANVAHGVSVNARTARPTWLGERVNVGYAIDVLHPLALRPSIG